MNSSLYKSKGKKGLFDEKFSRERLSEIGNPLETVSKVINFEMFRSTLEGELLNRDEKNNETFYGYKNHAKVDAKSKFIIPAL